MNTDRGLGGYLSNLISDTSLVKKVFDVQNPKKTITQDCSNEKEADSRPSTTKSKQKSHKKETIQKKSKDSKKNKRQHKDTSDFAKEDIPRKQSKKEVRDIFADSSI